MTIGDAIDINTVLRYLLGMPGREEKIPIGSDEALSAAMRLVTRANKALSAGLNERDIAAAWPRPGAKPKPKDKKK